MAKAAQKAPAKTAGRKAAPKMEVVSETLGEPITKDLIDEEPETETEVVVAVLAPEREAPAMEAAADPTDFDQLLDLSRAIDPKFGSETSKEGQNHFFQRILTAVGACSTEQFDSLPVTAQTWYENSVAEANAKRDITAPAGYTKPEAAAKTAAVKKTAVAKEKKAATPKTPKVKKEKAPRTASKTMPVRLAVTKNPAITLAELEALLPDIGRSTLSTTRSDTLATLEAAKNSGWRMPA